MVISTFKTVDYRNTSFRVYDFNLGDKKSDLLNELLKNKPGITNIYNNIKNRDNVYNEKFRKIYNMKCVYCGTSIQVIESSRFEVDHVIPISVIKLRIGYSPVELNGIGNLVNSCQMCNRGKRNFLIEDSYLEILHPDKNKLNEIFYRDSDFSIQIIDKYAKDPLINAFYYKLKFHNELRRVDYLLMEMMDFCEKHNTDDEVINRVQQLILKIEGKKRYNY